ncbi:MAG TPA: zf-HC2 domain-containing protein [Candidatus Angelobacter sp.]|nr:zf-HC2 domain-containing protein [Candidatus Angelobacter sp.]
MDHREIEERDIALFYLRGQLSAEERDAFEEHFVDCRECLDRIELLKGLRSGLKQVAVENAARAGTASWGWREWLIRLNSWQQAAFALGLVAAIAVVIALPLLRMSGELGAARRAAAAWEMRYHSEQETSAKLLAEMAANQSFAGATIFPLVAARSAEGPPVNRIVVSRSIPWIVFSLEGGSQPGFQSYRAILKDSAGATVWQTESLSPMRDSFAVVLPSRLIKNGIYMLTLEGAKPGSRALPVNHYSFRASIKQ